MLVRCFGGHFRKKAQNGGISAFWGVLTTFEGQKLLLRPKSEKAQKSAKDEKALFSLRARNSENVRFWARFWSPKRPKPLFFTFGPTFPFWSVCGAKSSPEAENELISTFLLPKVEKPRFCDSGQKGCPKRYVYKGFCASGEGEWKSLFQFLTRFHVFMSRKE